MIQRHFEKKILLGSTPSSHAPQRGTIKPCRSSGTRFPNKLSQHHPRTLSTNASCGLPADFTPSFFFRYFMQFFKNVYTTLFQGLSRYLTANLISHCFFFFLPFCIFEFLFNAPILCHHSPNPLRCCLRREVTTPVLPSAPCANAS